MYNDEFDVTIFLDGHTEKINKTLKNMSSEFVYIGFLLWEVQQYKYFKDKYNSLVEYAEDNFGFNKSSVYRFISICERFSTRSQGDAPTMFLDDRYKMYSLSQLGELISLNDDEIKQISPDLTIKQIRQFKKSLAEQEKQEIKKVPTSGKLKISDYSISTINTWFDDSNQMDNFFKYVIESGIIDTFLRKELDSKKVDEEPTEQKNKVKTIEDYPQINVDEVKTNYINDESDLESEVDYEKLKREIQAHNKDYIDSLEIFDLVDEKGIEKIRLYIDNAHQFKDKLLNAIKREFPINKGDN